MPETYEVVPASLTPTYIPAPPTIASSGTRRSIKQFDLNGTEHAKDPGSADFREVINRAIQSGEPLFFPKRTYRINSITNSSAAVYVNGSVPVDIECANEATFIPGSASSVTNLSGGLFQFFGPQPTTASSNIVTLKWRGGKFDGSALTATNGVGSGTGMSFIDVNGYSMVEIEGVTFDAGLTSVPANGSSIGVGWIDQGINEHACVSSSYRANIFRGLFDTGIYLSGAYDRYTLAAGKIAATANSSLFTMTLPGHTMKVDGTIGLNPVTVGGVTLSGEFVITAVGSGTVTFDGRVKATTSAASAAAVTVVDGRSTSGLSLSLCGTQSLIQGNRFYRCTNAVQSKRSHKHLLAQFNEFIECSNGVRTATIGDPLDEGKWVTISSNVFFRTTARPIVAVGGRKATIWDNIIENYGCTLAGDGAGRTDGMVNNNVCAIEIDSVENWSIRDNVVTNSGNWATPQTDDDRRFGIKVDAGDKYLSRPSRGEAVHNRLENVDQAFVESLEGADNRFENNTIIDEAVASAYRGYNSSVVPPVQTAATPLVAALTSDFASGVDGFSASQATLTASAGIATFTSTSTDPKLIRTGLAFSGAAFDRVRMRVRRTVAGPGDWAGRLYWTTPSRMAFASPYFVQAGPSPDLSQWSVIEWDLSGVADWMASTINSLRFDLVDNGGDTFEIDYVMVGSRPNAAAGAGSVSTGLSAAGASQAGATDLRSRTNVVTTVPSGSGVRLSGTLGLAQEVFNRGANALLVYPPTGAAIEAGVANAAVSLPIGGHATFTAVTPTQCYQSA